MSAPESNEKKPEVQLKGQVQKAFGGGEVNYHIIANTVA